MAIEDLRGCMGAVVLDLTEQKRAEEALRVSEAKFRNVFQNASLGKALVSMDGQVEYNNALLAMIGYTAEELHGRNWQEISHPDDWLVLQNALKGVREEHLAGARFEMRSVHKNGHIVWADVTLSLVKDPQGNPLYTLISVYDITSRKEADAALLDLKQHLQRYVEAERLHLAQELHDVPLQELYGILYRLEEVRPQTRAENAAVIGEVIGDVKSTLNSLRSIATELRPPTVSKLGFEKSARAHIQEFREKHPAMLVHASLKRDAHLLPEDTRLLLYRVLREAFSNIVRHARATEINVRFEFDAAKACLEITDNGKGFSVPENWSDTVRGGHYGLAGMSERLSIVGGTLEVFSAPGVSTTVRATLPTTPSPAPKAASAPRSRKSRR
jgi:PAS domain S-box-containing protein